MINASSAGWSEGGAMAQLQENNKTMTFLQTRRSSTKATLLYLAFDSIFQKILIGNDVAAKGYPLI